MSRHRSRESLVFSVATAAIAVHAVDDAFVHRQPGLGLGQHALAALVALVACLAGAVAFPSLRPGLRAVLAFGFGGLALVNGELHVAHVLSHGPAASDLTGVLAAAAGAVLLGLAATIPWRHRGEGAVTRGRRWAHRAFAVPAALAGIFVVLGPIGIAIVETHKSREPVGDAPSAAYRSVHFGASDGLELAGWYRPSTNGATVLLVHGGGSDRRGSIRHAQMLAGNGYGVLVYDARGRGESEGAPNGYGWDWSKDVDGALAFLKQRGDVDPGRIGALGLSTGADVLIEAAARRHDVKALVTDGAAAGSFEDWRRLRGTELGLPSGWVMFTAIRVLSGDAPGPPLADLVPRIQAPTLLISAGTEDERNFNRSYEKAARGRAEHWNLAGAQHTHGLAEHPAQYERRVVGFFNEALL